MEKKKTMLHTQKHFDFETAGRIVPAGTETMHVAEATSQPPPADQAGQAAKLVRPDRQLVYGGVPHYEWPDAIPLYDRDTISVDRIRDDIDGPSHRFIIKRHDQVEVFFTSQKIELGQVVGISHANNEVCVKFPGGKSGIWFPTGQLYPSSESEAKLPKSGTSLSTIIEEVNHQHGAELTEADRVPEVAPQLSPFTFEEFKRFHPEFVAGKLSFAEYQQQFEQLVASQDAIKSELLALYKAKELAVLASRFGVFDAKRSNKEQNAQSIVSRMLSVFVLSGGVSYSPMSGETYQEALLKNVRAVTEGEYHRAFEKRQAESQAKEKALENPETLLEFATFVRQRGDGDLFDEQLAQYDKLRADLSRKLRAGLKPKTVEQFQSDDLQALEFQIKDGFHDKRQCPLWIVQLTTRVERDAFKELKQKAKLLSGWYSSFKKSGAGFQFLDKENAQKFCSLFSSDADRSEVLTARKERQELTTAERLHELAKALFDRAEVTIAQSNDSLQNTARRADIQAGVRGRAFADQAMSRTLHSIAEALSRGEAKYLDGIRHKTQLESLNSVLTQAKWARIRALRNQEGESTYQQGRRLEQLEAEPISLATIRFVEFPYPSVYKRHLAALLELGKNTKGCKQAAVKLKKYLSSRTAETLEFSREYEITALRDFICRAKHQGLDVERVSDSLEKYQRLVRANITTLPELRAALREYLVHRAEARGDSPVQIAERELIGKQLPGFFPTPRPVIEQMLELADIEVKHKLLEPSCGKGDILDALQEKFPIIELHAIEQNFSLSDVLAAKGHRVEFSDFLAHQVQYDRIVMNPPFEQGQDMQHIEHAYSLLAPGGRLVSVISEGPFFRTDQQSKAFRKWLEEIGSESENLPEDSFTGRDAFRETGVRTRLLTINKE